MPWGSDMEHFTCCDEATTTFTIKKESIVFQKEITILLEINSKKHHRIKTKLSEWVDLDS